MVIDHGDKLTIQNMVKDVPDRKKLDLQNKKSIPQVISEIKKLHEKREISPENLEESSPFSQGTADEAGVIQYINDPYVEKIHDQKLSSININFSPNLKSIENVVIETDMILTKCRSAESISQVTIGNNGDFSTSGMKSLSHVKATNVKIYDCDDLKFLSDVKVAKVLEVKCENIETFSNVDVGDDLLVKVDKDDYQRPKSHLTTLSNVKVGKNLHLENSINLRTLTNVQVGENVHLEGCNNIDRKNLIEWISGLHPSGSGATIYLHGINFSKEEIAELDKLEDEIANLFIEKDVDVKEEYFDVEGNWEVSESDEEYYSEEDENIS